VSQVRAALYARVSTADQTRENQLAELRLYGAARGWSVREFVDAGVSGAKESRPALDDLLRAARRRQVDTLVCWRLDRLGRNLRHLILLLDELTAVGVGFVSLERRHRHGDTSRPVAAPRPGSHRGVRARARSRTGTCRADTRESTGAEARTESHPPLRRCARGAHDPCSGHPLGCVQEHGGTTSGGRALARRDKPGVIRSDFRPPFPGLSRAWITRGTKNRLS
jgi:hypothetical protein